MRDFDTIRRMALQLQTQRTVLIERMLDIQRAYEADFVMPLTDLPDEPTMPSLTPSLITDVIDHLAMRTASVHPAITSPALDATLVTGPRSVQFARRRIQVLEATYHMSGWMLARRRALRHLNAYETMSIAVQLDFKAGGPRLVVRSPLETFPEAKAMEDMRAPEYVAFITRYSGAFLRGAFPQCCSEMGGPITDQQQHEMWDVVEWHDCEQIRYGLLGPVHSDGDHIVRYPDRLINGGPWMPLTDPIPNRAEVCLAVTPSAVTLHRIGNRLNRLLESTHWQQKLMALEVAAQEKAVFPDMYVIGERGQTPMLIDGRWHDGRTGKINMIQGASNVGLMNTNPDPRNSQMIDRLERNTRVSSGLAPQMQGETHGASLRTGRALGQMAEMSIDPRIQELHEVDETWMPRVNRAVLSAYTGWWGRKKFTIFSGWRNDAEMVEFVPNEVIETTENVVKYAIPGADMVATTQILGSMLGANVIATETFQELHPWIANPLSERQRIMTEQMETATLEGLRQQVVMGQLPMAVFARIYDRFRKQGGAEQLHESIVAVDEEIRAEQLAAQEAAMQQQADLGLNAMPGLAAGPGAAAPGAPPGGMPMPGPAAPAGPVAQMRQLMSAATQMGG